MMIFTFDKKKIDRPKLSEIVTQVDHPKFSVAKNTAHVITHKPKVIEVKATVMNYFRAGCNISSNVINNDNFNITLNKKKKVINIQGINSGKNCISISDIDYISELIKRDIQKLGYKGYKIIIEN